MHYRIKLTPDDNGTVLVTSPDLPGMVTFGEDRDDAICHARDAIEEWCAAARDRGEDIPRPQLTKQIAKDEVLVCRGN